MGELFETLALQLLKNGSNNSEMTMTNIPVEVHNIEWRHMFNIHILGSVSHDFAMRLRKCPKRARN